MCTFATDLCCFFFFKQKTAYEMRISDWSSDVCSSDLDRARGCDILGVEHHHARRIRRQLDRALRDQHAVGAVAREDARTDELTGQPRRVRIREFGAQRRGARRFIDRSGVRRGGTECGSTCRYWW